MSTKSSIKWKERTSDAPGYHLYRDVLDYFRGPEHEATVHLELDGVKAEMVATDRGATVTVVLPEAIARELGILPPDPRDV